VYYSILLHLDRSNSTTVEWELRAAYYGNIGLIVEVGSVRDSGVFYFKRPFLEISVDLGNLLRVVDATGENWGCSK
ncbi:MAG: hypothetical protein ACREJQ_04880, partial [bacterium]